MSTMFRNEKNKQNPYVMLNKGFLRNPNLSAKSKGILAYLLSLPDDWIIYETELVSHFSDGRDSIRAGIKELIKNGYITKNRVRNEKGQLKNTEYKVFESPINVDKSTVQTYDGFSNVGKTNVGKPTTTNNDLTKEILEDDEETFAPVINIFVQAKGDITKLQKETIKQLVNTYSIDFVLKAIQVTSDKAKVFNMSYVKKVLKSYKDNGFETLKDIEDAENVEDVLKNNVNRKRKKNMIKQLETAPVKNNNKKPSIMPESTNVEFYDDAAEQLEKYS